MKDLTELVNESGLILSDAEEIKQSYLPFFAQIADVKDAAKKIDFENPTDLDERIARELRLKTVKIRTGSEEIKNNRKRIYQLRANVEQDSWNLIKSTCLIDEEMFAQVEKARERKEIARKEALKQERLILLAPYGFDATFTDLLNMPDDAFESLVSGVKLSHEARIEAEAKAQLERIEKEKAEAAERERIRLENERLKKEREELEKVQAAERKESEAKLKAEKLKLEKQQKEAAKAKSDQEEKIKKERDAKESAERELQAAKDAEANRIRLENARIEDEKRAKIKAEKEAAKAPDKTKLNIWIDSLILQDIPIGLSNESGTLGLEINNKFDAFKEWAKKQINQL